MNRRSRKCQCRSSYAHVFGRNDVLRLVQKVASGFADLVNDLRKKTGRTDADMQQDVIGPGPQRVNPHQVRQGVENMEEVSAGIVHPSAEEGVRVMAPIFGIHVHEMMFDVMLTCPFNRGDTTLPVRRSKRGELSGDRLEVFEAEVEILFDLSAPGKPAPPEIRVVTETMQSDAMIVVQNILDAPFEDALWWGRRPRICRAA